MSGPVCIMPQCNSMPLYYLLYISRSPKTKEEEEEEEEEEEDAANGVE
jgi:hypothetical protein